MNAAQALSFIRRHGVVLVSAAGPVPKLVEAIAGEPIKGSWWGHPKGHHIFAVLEAVTDSPDVLVCRLVDGKLTLAHRRVWPALVRMAGRPPSIRLAQVRQEHTVSGKHVNRVTPFPRWVPDDVLRKSKTLSEGKALAMLGEWADRPRLG